MAQVGGEDPKARLEKIKKQLNAGAGSVLLHGRSETNESVVEGLTLEEAKRTDTIVQCAACFNFLLHHAGLSSKIYDLHSLELENPGLSVHQQQTVF